MTSATSSRILTLLSLLQTRRGWSGQELAERLGVTPRTVRRDIDRLRELEYRIEAWKGPAGGYRLAAGSELPPLRFDDEQAVAIAVALRGAPALGVDIDEAAARALETVRQVMPSRLRHRVDGIRFTGPADASPAARVAPSVLEIVSQAARERHVLRFDYTPSPETAPAAAAESTPAAPRRVEPHAVIARGGRWYLVAWNLDRSEWRVYRLDRLTPRSPLGASFDERTIPTGDAGTFLEARFKGTSDANQWPCAGDVLLRVPAPEAANWLPDATVMEVDATTCRVHLGSWSWTGVLASIARFDADFEVLGPPELAVASAALATRFAPANGTALRKRLRDESDGCARPSSLGIADLGDTP
ncbi:helix-turn-helix transcriptional regulator [Pseudoclavibacter helvolus]|uniref:Putative DNA-binding transcriptional regulator YafY n=1 Tax=Pseudoclavibacter helvolus TaxID=255205 RepID=A0A7W4UP45_9MICO|nr:WYL domain-containing protein [Pseudoclavibacter helvolus]MBB2958041.1 putative DNA-binding transcriptional regulator YafY [Pseudoclavibacter helvolus]